MPPSLSHSECHQGSIALRRKDSEQKEKKIKCQSRTHNQCEIKMDEPAMLSWGGL